MSKPFPKSRNDMARFDHGDWKGWPELTVRLCRVPKAATTRDVHKNFATFGNIVFIELLEDQSGSRNGEALVKFEPPPKERFWGVNRHMFRWGNDNIVVEIGLQLAPPLRNLRGIIRSKINPNISYPAKIEVDVKTLQFGVMCGEKNIMVKKQLPYTTSADHEAKAIRMVTNFKHREIIIFFLLGAVDGSSEQKGTTREYKIAIGFHQIRKFFSQQVDDGGRHTTWITLPLNHPPRYFIKDQSGREGSFEDEKLLWSHNDQWVRTTYILNDNDITQDYTVGLLTHWDDPAFINIGRWTTLRIQMTCTDQLLGIFFQALQDLNITPTQQEIAVNQTSQQCILPPENQPVRYKKRYEKHLPSQSDKHGLSMLDESTPTVPSLPYIIHYQLEVCISRGIFSEYHLTRDFLNTLRNMDANRARYILEYCSDNGKRIENPMSIFADEEANSYYPNLMVPHYCAIVRKVLVTPTTIHLTAPSAEASNRVLRRYGHLQDRFLRVQFVDELNLGRIRSQNSLSMDFHVFRRVFHALINGIRIGDRHFKFLAFGNSQIRECGAYFFSETEDITCKSMRDWMGDFDHIRVVAKCAARIGQCFSTTRQIQGISTPTIVRIEDIEKGEHCFTDGVGRISKLLAEVVVQEMSIDTGGTPSAFQFRMGGCKGVLAVWPEVKGVEIHIRKSQEKFKAKFNGLEIIRMAQYSTASLNRQTITILSCLGVPPKAFLALVDTQLANFQKAMVDQSAAATLLSIYVDENQTSLVLRDLINTGFMAKDVREPFVSTIMHLWRSWSMKLLKEKARILVEKSAFVLGCVDETMTLRGHSIATEGKTTKKVDDLPQIFLQIPTSTNSMEYSAVKGVCLVGRNPSLHPGDLRMVEAVDCPSLRHLKNVVVFPGIGDRDVPGMLSGGDLDGDDFFVIWEPSLIPTEWNHPPMDYRAPKPEALNRDVTHQDLAQFFVKYMRNDCLPTIALNHLANADHLEGGAKNEKCVKLAALHSQAVDFVKSGSPAILTKDLTTKRWPHFMQKSHREYTSKSALGQIFDRVRVGDVLFSPAYETSFDARILAQPKHNKEEEMMRKLRQLKTQYDTAMLRLMAQMEIQTEFEVWTGFVLSKPRVGSGYKLAEEVGREASIIKQQFREEVKKLAGGSHIDILGPWVAAMYRLTDEEVQIAHRRRQKTKSQSTKDMPLISFPWIFHAQLGYIASGHWSRHVSSDEGNLLRSLPIRDYSGQSVHVAAENVRIDEPPTMPVSTPANSLVRVVDFEKDEKSALSGLGAVHLSDGRTIHRGEVLRLFDGDSGDEESIASNEDSEVTTQLHSPPKALCAQTATPIDIPPNQTLQAGCLPETTAPPRHGPQSTAAQRPERLNRPEEGRSHDPFASIFALARGKGYKSGEGETVEEEQQQPQVTKELGTSTNPIVMAPSFESRSEKQRDMRNDALITDGEGLQNKKDQLATTDDNDMQGGKAHDKKLKTSRHRSERAQAVAKSGGMNGLASNDDDDGYVWDRFGQVMGS